MTGEGSKSAYDRVGVGTRAGMRKQACGCRY
jgi:hypothetical protein